MTQQEAKNHEWSLDYLFTNLRNHKCKAFPEEIIPQEATRKQNEIYKAFGLKVPKSFAVTLSKTVD